MQIEILSDDVTVGTKLQSKGDVVDVSDHAAESLEGRGKARIIPEPEQEAEVVEVAKVAEPEVTEEPQSTRRGRVKKNRKGKKT